MRSHSHTKRPEGVAQLRLITTPDEAREVTPAPASHSRHRSPRQGRNLKMADRLDRIATEAQREAFEAVLAHDDVHAREHLERASAARKAAALLRAGPTGVRDLMAS